MGANTAKPTTSERAYDFRLKELTKALAVIDHGESANLILGVLSSQDTWNAWPVVQTLHSLLFNGVVLPTDQTLKIFETLLENVRTRLWNDQEVGLLVEALCVLPFIENASAGIARIREVVSDLRLRTYQLRDVASALGESRCRDAVELLRELTSDAILIAESC